MNTGTENGGVSPEKIHEVLLREGLLSAHHWRIAPQALNLAEYDYRLAAQIPKWGRILLQFYRACNRLYFLSTEGKMPGWIAELADAGKPQWLIELQRHPFFRNVLPRVIRPDLILTEEGAALTELDSVPGGIGLTACMQKLYLNGEEMLRGFASLFPGEGAVRIVVSRESESYRPEMEYLARKLGSERFRVVDESSEDFPQGCQVYRFFELFDWEQLPCARKLFERAVRGEITLTPPPKPVLEEKLFLGLLWNRTLRDFWHRELGAAFFEQMLNLVPRSWILDPTPLPPHGEYPQLGIHDWNELKNFTQSQRALVLKVSGFSELAWGSRGVWIGNDLSADQWAQAVDKALNQFERSPRILMKFAHGKKIPMEWYDFDGKGLRKEAAVVAGIFRKYGFTVVSVICKTGGISKEEAGIPEENKIHPGEFEAMCNPIGQAYLLNEQETEFNIAIGLCVGHDSLFFRNSQAPVTVLAAKDRVLAHNPCGAIYCAEGYFKERL